MNRMRSSQFFVNYALDVSIEVHIDDLHDTGPKPVLDLVRTNLSQTIRFKVWTVYEMGMRYENLKRERVLHEDRTEIVPNSKYLRVVLRSMGLPSCKLAPTPSVAGSVKQKPDDAELDTQECNTCPSIAVMCNSRQTLVDDRNHWLDTWREPSQQELYL